MVHAVVPDLDHRRWSFRLAALLTIVSGYAVFGWSLRFPAFVSFAVGAACFGLLDWHRTGSWRVLAGWSVASSVLLIGAAQIADHGLGGLVDPIAGMAVATVALVVLGHLYPGGVEPTDIAAGAFAAFALSSLGWQAPVVAFVAATTLSGLLGGRAILRQGGRAAVVVPFSALLALSAIFTALVLG